MSTHQRRRISKARRNNQKPEARTLVGYIGLERGRPEVNRDAHGARYMKVFLSERAIRYQTHDTSLVTVTGIWQPAAEPRKATRADKI